MKNEILTYLFGDLAPAFYVAFSIFAIIGSLVSMFIHLSKKKKGNFSFKYWLSDNGIRLVWAVIIAILVARFFNEAESFLKPILESINVPYKLNMFIALLIGWFSDKIIIKIRNKSKINIFQK